MTSKVRKVPSPMAGMISLVDGIVLVIGPGAGGATVWADARRGKRRPGDAAAAARPRPAYFRTLRRLVLGCISVVMVCMWKLSVEGPIAKSPREMDEGKRPR